MVLDQVKEFGKQMDLKSIQNYRKLMNEK
jgi:hypothetical protein